MHEHIERARQILGGTDARFAKAIGVSRQAVGQFRKTGQVSAMTAAAIERATQGQVKRYQLRPDIF